MKQFLSSTSPQSKIKEPHYIREAFTEREIDLMIQLINSPNYYNQTTASRFLRQRDKTILLFACYTGLRPAELLCLKWSDIDFESNLIYISPFNNKCREALPAIMPVKAREIILEYKKVFDEYITLPWIFPSLITFDPITTDTFDKKLIKLQKEAGIHRVRFIDTMGRKVAAKTFYSTRKYYGTTVYKRTKDLHLLKRALRHRYVSSGDPYVLISTDDTREKINNVF